MVLRPLSCKERCIDEADTWKAGAARTGRRPDGHADREAEHTFSERYVTGERDARRNKGEDEIPRPEGKNESERAAAESKRRLSVKIWLPTEAAWPQEQCEQRSPIVVWQLARQQSRNVRTDYQ